MRDTVFSLFVVLVNLALRLPGHALRACLLRSVAAADVGPASAIQRGVRLTTRGGIRIGAGCNINSQVLLDGRGGLQIGSLVNISPGALLLTAEHDVRSPGFAGRARAVEIGDRCWIATRAIVLPGASLGEGVVVAAGAIVRGRVPPWTIVAGNPARPIGSRPRDAQQTLVRYARFLH